MFGTLVGVIELPGCDESTTELSELSVATLNVPVATLGTAGFFTP